MELVRVRKVGEAIIAWLNLKRAPNVNIAATTREPVIVMLSVCAEIITLDDTVNMNFVLMTAQGMDSVIRKP